MKKSLFLGLGLLLLNIGYAEEQCEKLLVTESSKIKTILKNSRHDKLGSSDEIKISVSTSLAKLEEEAMFSEWFGDATHKQRPDMYLGQVKTDVEFFATKVTSDMEVSHEMVYGKHINILMVERDLAVPLGPGSIEVPFYIATGGNHDDLMFAKSILMNFFNHKGHKVTLYNDQGDELTVLIRPSIVKSFTRINLQKKYAQLKNESEQIIQTLERTGSHSAGFFELSKKLKEINGKLRYFKDLLDGKISNSCGV